jgi:hypothetical protein
MDVMTPEQIEELETGETRRVILNAYWKPCVHGGGWWIAKDADGVDRLLAPDDFADTLEAEVLRLTEANAALAEELARMRGALQWIDVHGPGSHPANVIAVAREELAKSVGMTGPKEIA